MKKVFWLSLLLVLLLASCNSAGSLVNPIIGTWETTLLGVTVSSVFNYDGTFTDTNSLGQVGVTKSGTWASESGVLTKTWPDNSTEDFTYTFNSNNSEMTLDVGGVGLIYTRM